MNKNLVISLLWLSCFAFSQGATQTPESLASVASPAANKVPIIVGGLLETGSGLMADGTDGIGLVRITPIVGVWLNGLGYFRLGYGLYNYSQEPDDGEKISVKHRDFSAQLGLSLGLGPYLQASYTRAKNLSDLGDVAWNEYALGLGTLFQIGVKSAFVTEVEYRWVLSHYNPFAQETVSGSRLQINLGFVVYVY